VADKPLCRKPRLLLACWLSLAYLDWNSASKWQSCCVLGLPPLLHFRPWLRCEGAVAEPLLVTPAAQHARRNEFDHIVIETTGLANPAPIISSFYMDRDLPDK